MPRRGFEAEESRPHDRHRPREKTLESAHDLSVREYSLLDVLGRQHDGEGGHLQVADAVVLSDVTDVGRTLLEQARPTNEKALREALDQAATHKGMGSSPPTYGARTRAPRIGCAHGRS
ncbi:hypothetical protein ABZT06_32130 [Streptomyces sp. NPDC005483]|uniref:hypothetical protein n=1 Tax=Streptomyces sp. NPDC005483 TaxID=3154882 RepID=UPI0033A2C91C